MRQPAARQKEKNRSKIWFYESASMLQARGLAASTFSSTASAAHLRQGAVRWR
jgi:hypothetical protein